MSISSEDAQVLNRVISTLIAHPDLINSDELSKLRSWAESCGAKFTFTGVYTHDKEINKEEEEEEKDKSSQQQEHRKQHVYNEAQFEEDQQRQHHTQTGEKATAAEEDNEHGKKDESEQESEEEESDEEEEEHEEEEEEHSEPDNDLWTMEDDKEGESGANADDIPQTESNEVSEQDEDKARNLKAEATDLASNKDYESAVAKLTEALKIMPNNAMYWGLRSMYQLELHHPAAALHDADRALSINPQNVRALRVRGTVRRHTGDYEGALKDLNDAQMVDYSESVNETMKFVQARVSARHARERAKALAVEAKAAKAREARRRRAEKAYRKQQKQQQQHQRGNPFAGAGGAGGGPGMPPGMSNLFQDPQIMAAMQDPQVLPKILQALQNPAEAINLLQDPKAGPVMRKLMEQMNNAGGGAVPPGRGPAGGFRHTAPPPPPHPHPTQHQPEQKPTSSKTDDLD